MRMVSFTPPDSSHDSFGVCRDEGIVDLGVHMKSSDCHQLIDLLRLEQTDWLDQVNTLSRSATTDYQLSDVVLRPPVTYPEKIACIGVNYFNRNEEYKDASDRPKYPSVFMRTPDSLVGHGVNILRPPESPQFDYEGEIAIIIGTAGRRIPEDQALSHIAGITCMNEGSVRDWLRHGKFNVTQGKNFVASGSLGPWMVTADEVSNFDELTVTTRVNGEQRQHDSTANLLFPFRFIVSYLSTFFYLKPGDVIATGTPIGAGARFDPPKYLKPGDVVEVEASHVGILRNTVADDPAGS